MELGKEDHRRTREARSTVPAHGELAVSVVTSGVEVIVSLSGEVDVATSPQVLAELHRWPRHVHSG